MHYACAKGYLNIIKNFHIKLKYDFVEFLQMKTNKNSTCLHLAVENGNIQLVEFILEKFSNDKIKLLINQQAEPFGTPLHIAGRYLIDLRNIYLSF